MKRVVLVICCFWALGLTGCSDDDRHVRTSEVTLEVQLPVGYEAVGRDSVVVTLKNASTGVAYCGKTAMDGAVKLTVEEGVYDISALVEKRSPESYGEWLTFQGGQTGVSVAGETWSRQMTLELSERNKEWLFRELYITRSKTTAGKQYQKDSYFVIYNNTDRVLYADGLSISETYQTTAAKSVSANATDWKQFWPDRVVVSSIYTVPGSGTDYPVQPGGNLVLADLGVNHTLAEYNSTSLVDMSRADFEWYDETNKTDTDVPEVPNLIVTYNSATIWMPNGQGNKSYVLFKAAEGMTMDVFLEANHVTDVLKPNGKDYYDTYAIPVKHIYDGVEFSANRESVADKALPNAVDAGFTYSTGLGSGLAVRRKVAVWDGKRAILQDTNDSKADFEVGVVPSPYEVK